MKLNTDDSANGNPSLAGCGGVIRDDSGQWIVGFSKCIGITSSFATELWGLKEGLISCCNLNITSLEMEFDAKVIVDILNKPAYVNNIISPILDDCRLLASRIPQIRVKHCFRQANRCADSLARMNFSLDSAFYSFHSPLVDLLDVFEDDLNGVYVNKMCHEPDVLI